MKNERDVRLRDGTKSVRGKSSPGDRNSSILDGFQPLRAGNSSLPLKHGRPRSPRNQPTRKSSSRTAANRTTSEIASKSEAATSCRDKRGRGGEANCRHQAIKAHRCTTNAAQGSAACAPPENKVAVRAGGLHAAFAQCAALRRMLTALPRQSPARALARRGRLHRRERAADAGGAHDARHGGCGRRGAQAQRGRRAARRARRLAAGLPLGHVPQHMLGTPSLTHAFLQWQNTCRAIEANRAVMAQTALRRWQSALGESLRAALKAKQGQLALTRKLMQKPVQLERELADMGAELLQAKEALEQCQRRLLVQQQKTSGAEARIKTLRNEVQAERRRSGGGGGAGGGASSTPRSKEPAASA